MGKNGPIKVAHSLENLDPLLDQSDQIELSYILRTQVRDIFSFYPDFGWIAFIRMLLGRIRGCFGRNRIYQASQNGRKRVF